MMSPQEAQRTRNSFLFYHLSPVQRGESPTSFVESVAYFDYCPCLSRTSSICVRDSFPFCFKAGMWDLILLVPGHWLSIFTCRITACAHWAMMQANYVCAFSLSLEEDPFPRSLELSPEAQIK